MTFLALSSGGRNLLSRRNLMKWGLCGFGAALLTTVPKTVMAQVGAKTLTFSADDVGILNFALLLEELEAAFYPAALSSGKITSPREIDYLRAIGNHEAAHVKFLRQVLGSNVLFQTADLSLNQAGLSALISDRSKILNTAVILEDLGVHAYNGAGPSLTNPTYLLAAGSIVSVEGRHAAGVRSLLNRPATEADSERLVRDTNLNAELNPVKGQAYDELYTPRQVVEAVGSFKILDNPINGSLVA
ncbi:ferritin-like domain-containing protein [Myxacorys almedinensis]|uniref:Ferritin-like domain-containing protein n=1 Tax=Myxacorys almedinensis A TaxID=2690445 RepID=A0A8J7Z7Y2_9CYAN|nr:ferritin-like domain-containing protein [Myxacorys almedinensis]NDJ19801.1 ferritin-like domain-containing protein [Myxacorys almedinensis A]